MGTKPCPMCGGSGEIRLRLGEKVRALREQDGLSQEQLARDLGVTRPQLANIEGDRSDSTPTMLVAIAKRFKVSADWLLDLPTTAGGGGNG